eukprot:388147_1
MSNMMKNMDEQTINIVCGYIRICRQLFPQNKIYYDIPSLVQYICALYYWKKEHFTLHGHKMIVNDEQDFVQKAKQFDLLFTWNTVYGNIYIDDSTPMIHEWIFKLKHKTHTVHIGIDSSQKQHQNTLFSDKKK